MTELPLSKTIQIRNIIVNRKHHQIRQYAPLSKDVNVVWQQVTKEDKQNKECYATFFSDAKEKIEKELERFEKNTVSQRVRKNRLDELNSIPKYRKINTTGVRL